MIYKYVKIESKGSQILNHKDESIKDVVASLIFAMSKTFISDPLHLKDKKNQNSYRTSNVKRCMILVGIKTSYNKDRNITSWLLKNGSLNFKQKKDSRSSIMHDI